MKKQGYAILMAFILIFALTGCGNKSLLSAKEPVELTMWHVYGEQAGSPMDTLVEEFNRTEGKEKGVRVKVTELSSAAKIGGFLLETQGDSAQEMPDLFTCHIGDAIALGEDNLLDWNDWFTEQEQSEFVSGFLADGKADDGKLLVFPLSKSTQLLMLNGTGFARFSAATGVTQRISTRKTAGMTSTTPFSRKAGCSLPARWPRGISWCPTSIPIPRS